MTQHQAAEGRLSWFPEQSHCLASMSQDRVTADEADQPSEGQQPWDCSTGRAHLIPKEKYETIRQREETWVPAQPRPPHTHTTLWSPEQVPDPLWACFPI